MKIRADSWFYGTELVLLLTLFFIFSSLYLQVEFDDYDDTNDVNDTDNADDTSGNGGNYLLFFLAPYIYMITVVILI